MINKCQIFLFAVIILFSFIGDVFAGGGVMWQENGVLVCDSTYSGGRGPLAIVSDSCGGAIIIWPRTFESLFAQRVDSSGNIKWDTNGVFVASGAYFFQDPYAVTDCKGGFIVTFAWTDLDGIYAQRVDSTGMRLWGSNGVCIRDTMGGDSAAGGPRIVSDGLGGAIISWTEGSPYMLSNAFVQRVDSDGALCWQSGGVPICNLESVTSPVLMINDLGNGIVVFWDDYRSGNHHEAYAQRIKMDGTVCWQSNGMKICSLSSDQRTPYSKLIKGNGDNIVIPWSDFRNGNWDIYAQRLDTNGVYQWADTGIAVCVEDSQQGFWDIFSVRSEKGAIYSWKDDRSIWYHDLYVQKIGTDGMSMWSDNGVFVSRLADTSQENHRIGVEIESDMREGTILAWEDYRAGNADIYCQRVDSLGALKWSTDGLPVCTTEQEQKGDPVIISDGKGGAIIAWGDDRLDYSVWVQRVGDIAGKKEDDSEKLIKSKLNIVSNPSVSPLIEYTVDRDSWISLSIYNLSGRLEKTLVNGYNKKGIHRIHWRTSGVPSGIYFCKFHCGKFHVTKKIVLLK